jgi:hypothetical protein
MKEFIFLTSLSGITFLLVLIAFVAGLAKKNKRLKLTSFILFLVFLCLTCWTIFTFVDKSYQHVKESFRPRTGDEIYDALFGKRQSDCITILNYQDQVVPKIDYAIWLSFETCQKELKRILSKHTFTVEKLPTATLNGKIPYGENLKWFNPTTLGDTLMVYEYSSYDSRNIQTIWVNLDSTKVFVRDILD